MFCEVLRIKLTEKSGAKFTDISIYTSTGRGRGGFKYLLFRFCLVFSASNLEFYIIEVTAITDSIASTFSGQ